ncbi:hypothetical protein DSO57_1001361 [Entomophthora muscae]|uniref:Uncharacterized protein n=1 Tax=Entomophthora muscae TaxID=34485 RepID=A0ACC2SY59_9FUNG|nr:hypothetical protein DSO57_1001361 [Entomophthora muscae]
MSSLLNFERAKFGVLYVETTAARKEVPTSLLEEAWASLEVTKTVPEEVLVEVKAVFEELYSKYFVKEETPSQGNQIYAWDSWNLLVGFDKNLQQVKAKANFEIETLREREEKSVKIMACWQDENKVLSHKIASLEAKILKALSQETNGNKSQGQDNGKLDWLDLNPSQTCRKFECPLFLIKKGSKDDVTHCAAVYSQTYSMVGPVSDYQGSHNNRTFLDFLQTVKENLWINYRSTTKIVVLDNVGLNKVYLVASKSPPIEKNSNTSSHCLADCPMRLLFLPPYCPFLNPIEEVFRWIKNKVKAGLPQDTKYLFNILEVSQFFMPPDLVAAFYKHSKSFLLKALNSKPIR